MKLISKNNQGMTLIEMAMAISLSSMILIGVFSAISYQRHALRTIHYTITRDHIQDLIQQIATDSNLVTRSINLSGNEKFRACLQGGTHTTCSAAPCCNKGFSGAGNDFVFLDPRVSNTTFSPISGEKFSGTLTNPQRYDLNGEKCTTPSAECPFVMKTSFSATCAGGAEPCDKAETILLTYSFGMDQNPIEGLALPIRTSTVPILGMNSAPKPSSVAFCWSAGTCISEPFVGGSWVVRTAPAIVPAGARKMLISYFCSEVNLNVRAYGSTANLDSTYLCYTANSIKNSGQAWVPLSSDLKYETYFLKTDPPSGGVLGYVIGWSK